MWRITDGFWDNWELLKDMFHRCALWQNHVSTSCYPDCDMLPLAYLGKGFGQERVTRFTREEQKTMTNYLALFNLDDKERTIECELEILESCNEWDKEMKLLELWSMEEYELELLVCHVTVNVQSSYMTSYLDSCT